MTRRGIAAALPLLLLASGCGAGEPAARRHTVEISAFRYAPADLRVAAGDTVVFVNRDAVPHTATAADGAWDTGSVAAGDSGRVVVAREGRHPYRCLFHPNMASALTAERR